MIDSIKKIKSHLETISLTGAFPPNTIVAGGAITSLVLQEKPNDYDVYFKDDASLKSFCTNHGVFLTNGCYLGSYAIDMSKKSPLTSNCTSRQFKLYNNPKVSYIVMRTGSPTEIVQRFDFIHTMNWYDVSDKKLVLNPESLVSIAQKELSYNFKKCLYPVGALTRIQKFVDRGWKIRSSEILKICLDVIQGDYINAEESLMEQLSGMYGFPDNIVTIQDAVNYIISNSQ